MADVDWDPSVWEDINYAVVAEVAKVRVAQKVFPTTVFDTNPTEVPDDVIVFGPLSIPEGRTKPFLEIYQEFRLTAAQVAKEPQLHTAKALARMAAKAIALGEDSLMFQGANVKLPIDVVVDGKQSAGAGLVGVANPADADDNNTDKVSKPIDVPFRAPETARPPIWGEKLFSAVVTGITKLTANKAQAPKYALILPVDAYADAFVPPSNASLVTTAERIRPLVEGGFYGTGTLPAAVPHPVNPKPGLGLLAALGGDPTTLYVGREAEAEFVRKVGASHLFRVVERVQFVARDPRAFVLLKLIPPPPPAIANIKVEPTSVTLTVGQSQQLIVTDSNGFDRTNDPNTKYTSADGGKVAVSTAGLMTGKASTAATKVTVTVEAKTADCTVTVS